MNRVVQQISRDEWMRRFGREAPTPQAVNIPGLPPADELLFVPADGVDAMEYAAARAGELAANPNDRVVRAEQGGRTVLARLGDITIEGLPRGRKGEGYAMDRQVQAEALLKQRMNQMVRDAIAGVDPNNPFAPAAAQFGVAGVLSQALGREIAPEVAEKAQQFMQILDAGPQTAVQLAELALQTPDSGLRGTKELLKGMAPAERQALFAKLQQGAERGEVRQDPFANALAQLNAQLAEKSATGAGVYVDAMGNTRDADSGAVLSEDAFDPMGRPIAESELSLAEIAALAPNSPEARLLPYAAQQLSEAETQQVFDDSGASRTRGGKRNPFARSPRDISTEAATFFTPGNVIGAGMEPNRANALIPLLIAPKNQEHSQKPGVMNVASVQVQGKTNLPGGAVDYGYRPGLADARILDVNPMAPVPVEVANALDLWTRVPLDKTDTGSYGAGATNVPTPDPLGGGFRPSQDPAASPGEGPDQTFRPELRPMTVAEAVQAIANRNVATVRAVRPQDLVNGDQLLVGNPGKGTDRLVKVYPLQGPRSPEEELMSNAALIAARMQPTADDPVTDVRVGSRGRYRDSLYAELDALVGGLAQYGGTPEGLRGQTAFPGATAIQETRLPAQEGRSSRPFNRESTGRAPVTDWGLLINAPSASRDDTLRAYQAQLLKERGIESEYDNPLFALLDNIKAYSGVPAGDVAIPAAGSAAARLQPGEVELENALRNAKAESRTAARMAPSWTDARRSAEQLARRSIEQTLKGRVADDALRTPGEPVQSQFVRDTLALPNERYRQPVVPGLEGEILFPPVTPMDPGTRALSNYMARVAEERGLNASPAAPQRVIQWTLPLADATPPAPQQGELFATSQFGAAQRVLGGAGGMAPSYVDDVDRYMARREAAAAGLPAYMAGAVPPAAPRRVDASVVQPMIPGMVSRRVPAEFASESVTSPELLAMLAARRVAR